MGGSSSKSESEAEAQSGSSSTFDQNVWGTQGDALNNMYGQAGQLFGSTDRGMQDLVGESTSYMNRVRDQSTPYWQDQMAGGVYQGMDLQGQYNNALQGGGNEQFIDQSIMGGAGNDYADAMKGQVMQDAGDLQNQMLANTDSRAAASGMSGGSRHGLSQAQSMKDINQQATDQLGKIGYDTFDKDLDRKLGIAQRADTYDMGRLNQSAEMLGNQQNTMNQGLMGATGQQDLGMGAFAPQMMPWESMTQYSNVLGNPTVLGSGSSESSMTSDSNSKGSSLSGGVGGGKG